MNIFFFIKCVTGSLQLIAADMVKPAYCNKAEFHYKFFGKWEREHARFTKTQCRYMT